tara:strand:- start:64 stop:885 length:822 start_codon:yes stop_codon:yes gene_type:complete
MIKKYHRIITKFLLIFFLKILSKPLSLFGIKLMPSYDKLRNYNFDYSSSSRRLIFTPDNNKFFNKIHIDTSLNKSLLCEIGAEKKTNKSPYNKGLRSGFTGLYSLLFASFQNKKINFAEIGIENNNSAKMWREYFPEATLHFFEYFDEKINSAKKDNLQDTHYHKIDVRSDQSIIDSFNKTQTTYDVIIDDSTHDFQDQIKIVKNCNKYLKKNGLLIIEDIYRFREAHSELNYYNSLKSLKNLFSEIVFIETNHVNNYNANWKNEKILLFVKK